MSRTIPRILIVSALSLLLLATLVTLWFRGPRHADLLMFYTPAGKLTGLASDAHGLLLCTTEIPFGNEMGLSAQTMSTSRDEFTAVHDLLFDPSNEKWHFLGFHTAAGTLGTWSWKFSALIIPYWALAVPLAVLPLTGFRRTIVRRRRKRRGQCLACGYDLRQSPDRCPECGKAVKGSGRATTATASDIRPSISLGGALSWVLLGIIVAACISAFARGRHATALAAAAPAEEAILQRPIDPIDLQNLQPMQLVRAVTRAGRARVELSGIPSASPVPVEPHFALSGIRVGAAVRAACEGWNSRNAEAIQLWSRGPIIHVAPASRCPQFVRCYPVGPILHDIQVELNRDDEDEARNPHLMGSVSNVFFASTAPVGARTPSNELTSLITSTVRDDDWVDNGGALGGLCVAAGRLWVCQTQEGHAAVRTFLAMLELPTQPAPEPAAENPHADLDQLIPESKLDSTTLESAIDTIRETTHANIVVYWDDLEKIGVEREAPIKVHLWDVPLGRALNVVLTLSGNGGTSVGVQDGIIIVGSSERIRNEAGSTRIYDVRDLIDMIRFEPQIAAAATRPSPNVNRDGVSPQTGNPNFEEAAEDLVKLIEDTVDTDSWKDNGGSIGTIRELAGRLIITQTPSAHRQIVTLLRTLRGGISKEGTELPGTRPGPVH